MSSKKTKQASQVSPTMTRFINLLKIAGALESPTE